MRILVLNAGSSTLKAAVLDAGAEVAGQTTVDWPAGADGADEVVASALGDLPAGSEAVGYRVVHGGSAYRVASVVDDELLERVEALDPLAPLHNLRAAAVMRAGRDALPELPHVACFDTAFHAGLPEDAWRYPLPPEWVERFDLRRYGFHGLSVSWSTRRAAELLERPVTDLCLVVAHLGSGCSVTAVEGGRSVDTSMGMTPYEGLMMGTRSGSIDPGILLHLLDREVAVHELSDGLARRSGLMAVAGTSSAREIEASAAAGDPDARLAVALFARRAAGAIASAATALSRLDAVVFTGGIGQHSALFRDAVTGRLGPLGVAPLNGPVEGDGVPSAGPPAVIVVAAREDRVIAEQVSRLLG